MYTEAELCALMALESESQDFFSRSRRPYSKLCLGLFFKKPVQFAKFVR